MKTVQGIAAAAAVVGSATAQIINGINNVNGINGINNVNGINGVGGNYPQGYPVCAQNCLNQFGNNANFQQTCQSQASYLANCIQSAGCVGSDLNNFYSYMYQNCQSAGAALNYAPYNNYQYSNGYNQPYATPAPGFNGQWPPTGTVGQAYNSYISAYPNGPGPNWSSFTSQYGLTAGPWGNAMPTGSWANYNNMGGMAGAAAFFGGMGMGMGGWRPGNGGPFGGQAPWGQLSTSAAWVQGPWTQWWNGNQCPASTWSGWTSGAWSTAPSWTTWDSCTAIPTATQVFTTILNGTPFVTSTFGYRVAQAQATGSNLPVPTSGAASNQNRIVAAGGAAAAGLLAVVAAL